MMRDIRRICERPTEEYRKWFPEIAGSPWLETLHFAKKNFKDESFILQFLSPRVIRELKLFSLEDNDENDKIVVTAIHDDDGYRQIRALMAQQYNLGLQEPDVQIAHADIDGNRSLTLHHKQFHRRPLNEHANEIVKHLKLLWEFDVKLKSLNQ